MRSEWYVPDHYGKLIQCPLITDISDTFYEDRALLLRHAKRVFF